MNRPANRLAIFDCDGTLVDSQHNICLCMERTFQQAALTPPSHAAVRQLVGLSLAELMAALLPERDDRLQRALVATYRTTFFDLHASGAMDLEPLFDGIAPFLARLVDDGWLLGVATGKSDRGLARVLAEHRIADHFVTLQTADRHPSKPHPSMIETAMAEAGASPATTVMIGDTSFDMMMARSANVRALGVAWGYHAPEDLHAAGAHAVADRPQDLLEIL